MFITTRVAIKEGILPYTTRDPLTRPMTAAIRSTRGIARPSDIPSLTTKPARKMDVMPMVEVMDMSMLPTRMTKNSPIAMMDRKAACRRMFMMLAVVLNCSLRRKLMLTSATNRNRIIHSRKKDLNPAR